MERITVASGAVLGVALLALGCGNSTEVVQPSVGGKGDINLNAVNTQGSIAFGEIQGHRFTASFQFFGYEFASIAGKDISVEITRKGTAKALDTTLFVYGPNVSKTSEEIAFDDDSGWGAQSRIESLVLPADGVYLIVVGTADGRGVGDYKLKLGCNSADCNPLEQPFSCEPFGDYVTDCVFDTTSDSEWDCEDDDCGVPQDVIDAAWEDCALSADSVESHKDGVCSWALEQPGPVPGWCAESFDGFFANRWPACPDELEKPTPDDFIWD